MKINFYLKLINNLGVKVYDSEKKISEARAFINLLKNKNKIENYLEFCHSNNYINFSEILEDDLIKKRSFFNGIIQNLNCVNDRNLNKAFNENRDAIVQRLSTILELIKKADTICK